jgi:hypothetical protein
MDQQCGPPDEASLKTDSGQIASRNPAFSETLFVSTAHHIKTPESFKGFVAKIFWRSAPHPTTGAQ